MKMRTWIAIVVLLLATFGVVYLRAGAEEQQVCTTEAKLCPDGSAVGRTGPNCTFPACPGGTTTNVQ